MDLAKLLVMCDYAKFATELLVDRMKGRNGEGEYYCSCFPFSLFYLSLSLLAIFLFSSFFSLHICSLFLSYSFLSFF